MNLVKPEPINTTGSITRSTTGTYFDSAGIMQTAAINAVRINHNPDTKEFLGLLIENASTNLLTYSEQFDNAAWTKSASSIAADTVIAPDGTLTGDKLVEDTATSVHVVQQVISFTTGTTSSFSVYVKAAERTRINIQAATSATFGISANFDLSNGTVISAILGSASIQSVGNGWYRCTATGVSTQTLSSNVRINLISTGTTSNYTGDGTSGVFLWGAQLNVGAVPAAYLQTVATAVTTAYAAPIESPNGLAFPLLATMTPARNADMTFELASNTSLVVKVRGSDGTVRSATLLLV